MFLYEKCPFGLTTENPRVGGSNPPPGTIKIKQVADIINLNRLSIIYIHLNIHPLPPVPPTIRDHYQVYPYYITLCIHGCCLQNKIGWTITMPQFYIAR